MKKPGRHRSQWPPITLAWGHTHRNTNKGSGVRGQRSEEGGNLSWAYLAGARTAGVTVGAAGQQALAGGAERKTREAEGAAVTAAAAEAPPTLTLTCRGRKRERERER